MILIIDANYIARRALHSTPRMQYKNKPTGTIFGFVRDLSSLLDRFEPKLTIFCFDGRHCLRKEFLPSYKAGRDNYKSKMTAGEWKDEREYYDQVQKIKDIVLPEMGFKNIYFHDGYEADDLIAKALERADDVKDTFVIVSSDKDLFQLLAHNVQIWNPQKKFMITRDWFHANLGIFCGQWVMVKAIAGCDSDNIRGVYRVGEKTAIRYIRDELPETSKAYQAIMGSKDLIKLNKHLVRLPFPGTPASALAFDDMTRNKWNAACRRFGLESLSR